MNMWGAEWDFNSYLGSCQGGHMGANYFENSPIIALTIP